VHRVSILDKAEQFSPELLWLSGKLSRLMSMLARVADPARLAFARAGLLKIASP